MIHGKKMCSEVLPCIFEPKSKVPVDKRSVYQLLSARRTGKRENILKYKGTEKTHATLRPKKRFPMYIDQIHFLAKRAGWKTTKVHLNRSPLKKNTFSVIRRLDRRPWA